jgi:hypothetical protein
MAHERYHADELEAALQTIFQSDDPGNSTVPGSRPEATSTARTDVENIRRSMQILSTEDVIMDAMFICGTSSETKDTLRNPIVIFL